MRASLPLLVALLVAATATVARGAVPGAEVVPGAAEGGGLRIDPSVTTVAGTADDGAVTHRVVNGTTATHRLALVVATVAVDPVTGPAVVAPAPAGALPASTAELAPGEVLTLSWHVPRDGQEVMALTATAPDGSTATAFVVPGAGTVDRAEVRWTTTTAAVELGADAAAVTDLRLRVTTWYGTTTADVRARDLLVGAGGRRLRVAVDEGWLPGPRTLQLVAGRDGVVTYAEERTRVEWPGRFLVALAVALLAVAGASVLRAYRRRPRRPVGGRTPDA